eukprot:1431437-Amphidinium_carterae.1
MGGGGGRTFLSICQSALRQCQLNKVHGPPPCPDAAHARCQRKESRIQDLSLLATCAFLAGSANVRRACAIYLKSSMHNSPCRLRYLHSE